LILGSTLSPVKVTCCGIRFKIPIERIKFFLRVDDEPINGYGFNGLGEPSENFWNRLAGDQEPAFIIF
jgi:hypothetical protein